MLVLDAELNPPTHCLTLTTHDPDTASTSFRVGVQKVFNRRDGLRRFWDVEYFAKVEFTTGKARRSGGRRRMHAHFLLKGLDQADVLNVERIARERWEAVTGAYIVEVAELRTPSAALHYLGLHHAKASQLPPSSWRGMVERASKGYWSKPIGELRAEARAQLWAESLAWSTGLALDEARFLVDEARAAKAHEAAELRRAIEELHELTRAAVAAPDEAPVQLDVQEEFPF